jgi:hypothetical protein
MMADRCDFYYFLLISVEQPPVGAVSNISA